MRRIFPCLVLGAALLVTGCDDDPTDPTDSTDVTDSTDSTDNTDDTDVDDGFVFATDAPSAYTRVDRAGMPAINTAVITSKDAYNQADPADDANGDFVDEIVASVTALHGALDDDLAGLGLTPCAVSDCVSQAAPLVVPDTLKIDPAGQAGFPNGRLPADPVIDVTLAVVLLDLSVHGADLLATVPLNPPANDLAFPSAFPYLADPH